MKGQIISKSTDGKLHFDFDLEMHVTDLHKESSKFCKCVHFTLKQEEGLSYAKIFFPAVFNA